MSLTRKLVDRNGNYLLNPLIANLNCLKSPCPWRWSLSSSFWGFQKATWWKNPWNSSLTRAGLAQEGKGCSTSGLCRANTGIRCVIYGRILSINSSWLVITQQLFVNFRSSWTTRTVHYAISRLIRKSNVTSDETQSVLFWTTSASEWYFQHRDVTAQSQPFLPSIHYQLKREVSYVTVILLFVVIVLLFSCGRFQKSVVSFNGKH